MFNHESPLCGETFVTCRINRAGTKIGPGLQDKVYLVNPDSQRDWGQAKGDVEAMALFLQNEKPEELIIATGISTIVRDFVIMEFAEIGVDLALTGDKDNEMDNVVASTNPEYPVKEGKLDVGVGLRY